MTMAERIVKLSEEELKEILIISLEQHYGGSCTVKDVKFRVGTTIYDDDPEVSCEVKIEIPVLTLPL